MTDTPNVPRELSALRNNTRVLLDTLLDMREGRDTGDAARDLIITSSTARAAADLIEARSNDPIFQASVEDHIVAQHHASPTLPANTAELIARFRNVQTAANPFWAFFIPQLNAGDYDKKPRVTLDEEGNITNFDKGLFNGTYVQNKVSGANGDWAEIDGFIAALRVALGVV